jgi:hypothetical protein
MTRENKVSVTLSVSQRLEPIGLSLWGLFGYGALAPLGQNDIILRVRQSLSTNPTIKETHSLLFEVSVFSI